MTWRDDPEVEKWVNAMGPAYRLGKDVLRSGMATAVAARDRELRTKIEALPTEEKWFGYPTVRLNDLLALLPLPHQEAG